MSYSESGRSLLNQIDARIDRLIAEGRADVLIVSNVARQFGMSPDDVARRVVAARIAAGE